MKTLIITLEYPPQIGGVASYILNFLLHVNPDDFALYAKDVPGGKDFDQKHTWKTYRYQPYYPFWPQWLRMFFQVLHIKRVENGLKELHIHQVLPGGYIGFLFKKFFKIPYVVFLHGSDVTLATKTAWKKRMFRMVVKNADRVVVNSHFLEHRVQSNVDQIKDIKVLYPCPGDIFLENVPVDQLESLRNKLALQGKKVVITVSRMVDGKGYPHIIRLLSQVCREVPNVVWFFIGDGPKRQTIMDLVQRYYLQNVVRFLGAVPNDELPQYYQIADLFVLLSHADDEAEESWGSVFLEAAASGVPVVAGRVGGVEEAVEHQRTGIVIDVYQEKAVVNSIVQLLKNDQFAKELGRAGRERVQNEFRWDKQVKKVL